MKRIMEEINLDERTEPYDSRGPRITLTNHKPNFITSLPVPFICPSSSDIGNNNKFILDKYIPVIKVINTLELWDDYSIFVYWFRSMRERDKQEFVQFNIEFILQLNLLF